MSLYRINKSTLVSFTLLCLTACSLPEKQDSRAIDSQSLIPICVNWGQYACGLINRSGESVAPPIYRSLYNQSDVWIGERSDGKTDVLDLQGRSLGQIDGSNIHKLGDGILIDFNKHFYRYDGTEISLKNSQVRLIGSMSEELISAFGLDERQKYKSGYVDMNLQWVIPPTYNSVGDFHQGFAEAFVGDQDHRKITLIDKTGKMRTPLIPGIRLFWLYDNKWLRWTGKPFKEKSDLIDTTGQVLISDIYTAINEKGIRIVPYSQGGESGLLDLETLKKNPIPLADYNYSTNFSDGVLWMSGKKSNSPHSPKSWLLVNQQGQTLFEASYRYPSPFYQGFSVVLDHNGDYGVIDKNNRIVFPFEYKDIQTPWLTWAQTPNFGDVWWLTKKSTPDAQQLMNSSGKLIATVQHRVVQKKGEPCGRYTNGIEIVTNAKGKRLWEKERLEACQR
ncbi:Uncharacterised protein [Leminorella richardii]|uniref:KWG Leptospira n=2 Tax=Leminorella richardii TaxID=158841 RepID=A0A2X4VGK8_9GAMM|nr:Uncharacterised protein [Leminorella richardii]